MQIVGILFAVLFTIVGTGALYLHNAQQQNANNLDVDGMEVMGIITDKNVKTRYNSKRRKTENFGYEVSFSFIPHEQKERQGKEDVSFETFKTIKPGQKVPVHYWPEDPDIATIFNESYSDGAAFLKWMSWGMFSTSGFIAFLLFLGRLRVFG
ncbi:hypothetical protein WH96_15670 [Kiloniella spongiae]|uniref:DUF3592 domain-containing protein n=1 Tax=Kiloniella spongiae TaxID=1489064 RepID=A0A0H2MT13_9PROT|nr:DUF3592 domain-containing protein [Kiloniella spongiae]KLN59820.1 hypothetical protein WH96_15670 [Kiloniella spongiae]